MAQALARGRRQPADGHVSGQLQPGCLPAACPACRSGQCCVSACGGLVRVLLLPRVRTLYLSDMPPLRPALSVAPSTCLQRPHGAPGLPPVLHRQWVQRQASVPPGAHPVPLRQRAEGCRQREARQRLCHRVCPAHPVQGGRWCESGMCVCVKFGLGHCETYATPPCRHSLGGALATLCAYDIKQRCPCAGTQAQPCAARRCRARSLPLPSCCWLQPFPASQPHPQSTSSTSSATPLAPPAPATTPLRASTTKRCPTPGGCGCVLGALLQVACLPCAALEICPCPSCSARARLPLTHSPQAHHQQ